MRKGKRVIVEDYGGNRKEYQNLGIAERATVTKRQTIKKYLDTGKRVRGYRFFSVEGGK